MEKIENNSGFVPLKKNGVLLYIGDTEFFQNKLSSILLVTEDEILSEISKATEGIVIAKGSEAFKNDFDYEAGIGTKVSFKGFHGQMYSKKAGTFSKMNREYDNKAYYRIMKDSDIEAICTN